MVTSKGCLVQHRCTRCRQRPLVVRASTQQQQVSGQVEKAVSTLKRAAATRDVKPVQVFDAMRQLEKLKLQDEEWPGIVGRGDRWQLVFTTGVAKVREAMKNQGKGGGNYFPLTAAQRWDARTGEIENGIFLGLIAALTFKGGYAYQGKKLSFDFDRVNIKLGPLKFEFKIKDAIVDYKPAAKDPFFIIFYVDDEVICARGRGGGIALWKKTEKDFDMKNLVA
ncbi:hypothetical protein M9435_004189 [Picochlorum sp. BPE23]|nr:hypothetical protein M9435_004189 [Picochlorum sp. BPE23]